MSNFPFVMQLSDDDCGAACVAMLIKKICQIDLAIGEIRYIIKTDENGSTYLGIKRGLNALGVHGEVIKVDGSLESLEEFKEKTLITQITKNNQVHYILIYKITKRNVLVADPSKTKLYKMKTEEFLSLWIPFIYYVKEVIPTPLLQKYKNEKKKKIGIQNAIFHNKGKIIASWIAAILGNLLSIISVFSFTVFFDAIMPLKLPAVIPLITMIFTVILVFQILLNFLYTKLSVTLNNQIDLKLSSNILNNVFSKRNAVIENLKEGELITRLRGVSQIREKYLYWILRFPVDVLMMLMTFIILFDQNSTMTLLVFIPMLLSVMVVYLSKDRLRDKSLALYNDDEKFNVLIIHVISSLETIKSFSVLDHYKNLLVEKLQKLKTENKKFLMYATILSGIKNTILSIFSLFVFAIGAYYVISGKLGSGTLLMFNSLSMQILNPFMAIANMQTTYEQGKIAELKCEDLLQTEYYRESGKEKLEVITRFAVKNLNFEYQVDFPVLIDVNAEFMINKSYAIIGASGSGKTTFAKILANYYCPTSGNVEVNGISMETYDAEDIQKNIIYIQQNVEVFSASILENILMGRNIPIEIVNRKAKEIGFDTIIDALPLGYDTIIGESGLRLSMGQTQLLNILRATLEEYQVIIFDEVTNGLDRNYRGIVKNYLANYGNIKIFITHDMEFAKSCDCVLKIANGSLEKTEII